MICKKCKQQIDEMFDFCPKCGEKINDDLNDSRKKPSSCFVTFVILSVLGMIIALIVDSIPTEKKETKIEKTKEEVPQYTVNDAARDVDKLNKSIKEMLDNKNPDFSQSIKYSNFLDVVNSQLNDVIYIFPNTLAGDSAVALRNKLPSSQKKIFPKIRRAWVAGLGNDIGMRVKCRNKSCNEIKIYGDRYLLEENVRADQEYYSPKFEKFRIKKVYYEHSFGGGTSVTIGNYYNDSELK